MPGGRPTVMDENTVNKLEEAFLYGATDEEACLVADISRQTLYDYQKLHPEFVDRKNQLKQNPIFKARKSVIDAMISDGKLALDFLQRKKKDEFSLRTELTGAEGNPIIVMPPELINKNGINSTSKAE